MGKILRWRNTVLSVLVLQMSACASTKPPAPVDGATLPLLPRSSIAAVVLHRAALRLSDEQVRQLELLDQEREKASAAILEEVDAKKRQAASAASAGATPGGSNGGGGGMSAGGMRGGGMGGGGMRGGGMGGGGMRGRHQPSSPAHASGAGSGQGAVQDRLDEADTKAYLDAEEVLTEDQRAPAREVASEYREQLYERRANTVQGSAVK